MEDCGIPGCPGEPEWRNPVAVKGKGWPKKEKTYAQYDGLCPECGGEIEEGDEIHHSEYHDGWVCHPCRGS